MYQFFTAFRYLVNFKLLELTNLKSLFRYRSRLKISNNLRFLVFCIHWRADMPFKIATGASLNQRAYILTTVVFMKLIKIKTFVQLRAKRLVYISVQKKYFFYHQYFKALKTRLLIYPSYFILCRKWNVCFQLMCSKH